MVVFTRKKARCLSWSCSWIWLEVWVSGSQEERRLTPSTVATMTYHRLLPSSASFPGGHKAVVCVFLLWFFQRHVYSEVILNIGEYLTFGLTIYHVFRRLGLYLYMYVIGWLYGITHFMCVVHMDWIRVLVYYWSLEELVLHSEWCFPYCTWRRTQVGARFHSQSIYIRLDTTLSRKGLPSFLWPG